MSHPQAEDASLAATARVNTRVSVSGRVMDGSETCSHRAAVAAHRALRILSNLGQSYLAQTLNNTLVTSGPGTHTGAGDTSPGPGPGPCLAQAVFVPRQCATLHGVRVSKVPVPVPVPAPAPAPSEPSAQPAEGFPCVATVDVSGCVLAALCPRDAALARIQAQPTVAAAQLCILELSTRALVGIWRTKQAAASNRAAKKAATRRSQAAFTHMVQGM
jgi:hypothetical protein